MDKPTRSFIIPVLDYSPHSPYNINTLLTELENINGEVICVFNSHDVFEHLKDHPRIDKYCLNSQNAGVSRSWNIGINLAEGDYLFILNADLHIGEQGINKLEMNLEILHNAVMVGPEGSNLKFIDENLSMGKHFSKGTLGMPENADNISGFYMAIHKQRFLDAGLYFDTRFSPCFMEEWDIGFQIRLSGLLCYVVPLADYAHEWGISAGGHKTINYFGQLLSRDEIMNANAIKFRDKWFEALCESTDSLLTESIDQ